MRTLHKMFLVSVGLAAAMLTPCHAAVVVKIKPVGNSTSMSVFGINDHNVIVGGFVDKKDDIEHAFSGPLNGTYSRLDLGNGGSEARGINNAGYITGIANTKKGDFSSEPIVERLPDGKIVQVTQNGTAIFGLAQGINNSQNKFAGGYWDRSTADFSARGFLGSKGQWRSHVYVSAPTQELIAYGINSNDVIVGQYLTQGTQHGFIRNGKEWSTVDFPSSAGTQMSAVNDKGKAVGHWYDGNGHEHSFLLDVAANTFTDIEVAGAKHVEAWAINSAGAVVVNTNIGSFIWCEKQKACPAGSTANVDAPVHFVPTGLGKHFY